jgi:hypothetical protein
MKATFYGHFVAGEDREAIKPTIARLNKYGVGAILDYSVEEDLSEEDAEKAMGYVIGCVESVNSSKYYTWKINSNTYLSSHLPPKQRFVVWIT